AVLAACECSNAFGLELGGPLPHSEIKATAKSIARWVWNRFTPAGFSQVQAHRGAKGGKVSKRPTKGGMSKAELLPEVLRLKAEGYSNRDIAEDLQISPGSVSNYLNRDRE
ncbi:MAG: LuxR C-terminal-related transcriptional regulator, partial [Aeromonas sp.]